MLMVHRSKSNKSKKDLTKTNQYHNGENCSKCKKTVSELLNRIYFRTNANHKFTIGVYPEDFKHTKYYSKLKSIFKALQNHRGHKNFVRVKNLPRCDYFVLNPPFILEFDESQHFTLPRKKALRMYPKELKTGFSIKKWIEICDEVEAKDNDPIYRDEQRAWYDTLRDFLPAVKKIEPTIRINWKEYNWCELNPDSESDIRLFKQIISDKTNSWDLSFHIDSNPELARIIIAGDWKGEQSEAKNLLSYITAKWPKNYKVKCITTCGGFIQFDWPQNITRSEIGENWNPKNSNVELLLEAAKNTINTVLTRALKRKLSKITDYITIGIDSKKEKISTTENYIGDLHIELVFLYDLRSEQEYWTGKSYPTSTQEHGLVRIRDLRSHFLKLENLGKVMILGCHDLTIFNPRSHHAEGRRKEINDTFLKLAIKEKPDVVLHHPHTTDSHKTWIAAWKCIEKILPNRPYLGSGRYYRPKDKQRSDLYEVLQKTKLGNTIDCIVQI